MIIDGHHHLWDPARRAYPWLVGPGLQPLRRRYHLGDLRAALPAEVGATVLVQTVSDRAETAEFLATAAGSAGLIAGVVGWVDLTAPDVADQIAELRAGPGGDRLVGVRHQVQDEPDPRWLLRPAVLRGLRAVAAAGLRYDLLVTTPQLPAALTATEAVPRLEFVLDHLAKPPIAADGWQPWAAGLAALASRPNVTAKVSGLVTEDHWRQVDPGRLRRYADLAWACFGPDRLMFGSDWPVCTLVTGYAQVLAVAGELAAGLSPAERSAFFAGTAQRVYRLAIDR